MKIGDYVRTDTGQIGKITYFEGDMVRVDCDKFITYKSNHNEIIKSSSNIIDLIEVGDYVDRLRVVDKEDNYIVVETFDERIFIYKNEPIKSIVTREQFESMEYRL